MTYDQNTPIAQFLQATASKQPTPGGGSVAALTGALAAAIGEMTVQYSLGKKSLEAYADELRPAQQEFQRARQLLLDLMVEDQNAYQALTAVRKLPEDSPQRKSEYPVALLASIRTPESIAATAVATLELCDRVINFVNFYLLSDLAVCADLSMATVRCAVYNVRVNLSSVTDPADRQRIESTVSQMLSRAAALIQRVGPRIWERHEQGS
jgi:formiminotetrahydrofolate cyclodeaminase